MQYDAILALITYKLSEILIFLQLLCPCGTPMKVWTPLLVFILFGLQILRCEASTTPLIQASKESLYIEIFSLIHLAYNCRFRVF